MPFLPIHLLAAYLLDLAAGDPRWLPHPVRWIGWLIQRIELRLYDGQSSRFDLRARGFGLWVIVVFTVIAAVKGLIALADLVHPVLAAAVMVWLAYTTLATRSLHRESAQVAEALAAGDLASARQRLSWIVSRDTAQLEEPEILRALVETVSENLSDGIVAPLCFLAIGGPEWAMAYKAVNTMDSMVGYLNERYQDFGWFAARADDVANWIPARLSALMVAGAAAILKCDWRAALAMARRDARKMKSPNAGYPEAAVAGALGVQVGGTNIYFGKPVEKPTLGDPHAPLTLDTFRGAVRLMYGASLLALIFALAVRLVIVG